RRLIVVIGDARRGPRDGRDQHVLGARRGTAIDVVARRARDSAPREKDGPARDRKRALLQHAARRFAQRVGGGDHVEVGRSRRQGAGGVRSGKRRNRDRQGQRGAVGDGRGGA